MDNAYFLYNIRGDFNIITNLEEKEHENKTLETNTIDFNDFINQHKLIEPFCSNKPYT